MEQYKDPLILPPEDERLHLDFVQKQILQHPVVKVHHGKWRELIDWESNGNQFSIWDEEAGALMPVQLKRRKKRVVINLMKPLAETIEGKLNMQVQYEGVPNSSELKDINGAQVATKFLAHNDYVNDNEALNEDLKYDLVRTGNAFKKWTWDTSRTGYVKGQQGRPKEAEGELVGAVPSVFNIRIDPVAKCMEDARWLIEIGEVTEESVCEAFGIEPEDIKAALEVSGKIGQSANELKYKGMNEKENEKDRSEKTYIMAWYWERKSTHFPEGRHIISIEGMVLWAKKNPALGKIPYFHYGYKRSGNSIWHTGPLHHIQDIQRDFNRMVSIISEHIEGWRAKVLVDKNQGLKQGAFTTDSFEILEIDMSKGEPRPMQSVPLSREVLEHRDFLITAKDMVSNVHEVSYSQLPQYATRAPASLYAQMVEQENLKIDPMVRRFNRTIKKEATFRLEMMSKYYDEPRMVKIIGVNERSSVDYFRGSQMEGNYDVKLLLGVSIHQSKTIQQRMILDLKQAGAPIEWSTIFKLLWEGDISEKIRGDIADERRASRENQAFLEGTWQKKFKDGGVQIMFTDNHALHLDSHTKLTKSEEAQRWDEDTWAGMNQHIFEHFAMIKFMMQRSAANASAGAGAAVATGAAPPPEGGEATGSPAPADQTQAVEDSLPF